MSAWLLALKPLNIAPCLAAPAALQLGCVVLLALLFRIIARAADDFFSCILSQISQDLGLPPRLGGVTLLALGNGAPDLSASIAAVKSGALGLSKWAVGCVEELGRSAGWAQCVVEHSSSSSAAAASQSRAEAARACNVSVAVESGVQRQRC